MTSPLVCPYYGILMSFLDPRSGMRNVQGAWLVKPGSRRHYFLLEGSAVHLERLLLLINKRNDCSGLNHISIFKIHAFAGFKNPHLIGDLWRTLNEPTHFPQKWQRERIKHHPVFAVRIILHGNQIIVEERRNDDSQMSSFCKP